jgi:hypothetical protein
MRLFKKKKSKYDQLLEQLDNIKDINVLNKLTQDLPNIFAIETLKMKVKSHKFLIIIQGFNFGFNLLLLIFLPSNFIFTTVLRIVIVVVAGYILFNEIKHSKRDKIELAKEMLKSAELLEE